MLADNVVSCLTFLQHVCQIWGTWLHPPEMDKVTQNLEKRGHVTETTSPMGSFLVHRQICHMKDVYQIWCPWLYPLQRRAAASKFKRQSHMTLTMPLIPSYNHFWFAHTHVSYSLCSAHALTPKEHTYHLNTFMDALNANPCISLRDGGMLKELKKINIKVCKVITLPIPHGIPLLGGYQYWHVWSLDRDSQSCHISTICSRGMELQVAKNCMSPLTSHITFTTVLHCDTLLLLYI